MNRRIGRISVVVFMVSIILTLTGCQLAQDEVVVEENRDKLIGVYITYEHLDLFDFESYMEDNIDISNGEIIIDGDTRKYNGRLYASLQDKVISNSDGGSYTVKQFVFEGIEGAGLFTPTVTDPNDQTQTYISSSGDDGFSDVKTHVKSMDNEEGIELEGTVYVKSSTFSNTMYINPVYQSADGSVYLVQGSGQSASGNAVEGASFSQTLTDKVTIKENDISKSYSSSIKVSIATMFPTEEVTVLQMDQESNIVKKDIWKPEEVPKELKAESSTDYMIVETVKTGSNQEKKVERTVFTKEDQSLWYFSNRNGRIFIKENTTILWDHADSKAKDL